MQQTDGAFLFFYPVVRRLIGSSGTYVDVMLRTGNEDFKNDSTTATNTFFDTEEPQINNLIFTDSWN